MVFRIIRALYRLLVIITDRFDSAVTVLIFNLFNVRANNFRTKGIPVVRVKEGGLLRIGENFTMNNGYRANLIGRQQKCLFVVGPNARLEIGDNVGISSSAIVCRERIIVGNNVLIGGNTVIYDTDFHPLSYDDRAKVEKENFAATMNRPVIIGDHVFIGAHSTILKGVTIGPRSIIGAASVVTKDVPGDEIWGGNPAKFIRKTSY